MDLNFDKNYFRKVKPEKDSPLYALKDLFDKKPDYRKWYYKRAKQTAEKLTKELNIKNGKLLDFGCGTAMMALHMEQKTECSVFGFDLETLAMHKPLIAAKVGGIPEVIKHMQTGLLFEAGNAEELKNEMKLLIQDPVLRKNIALNGFNHVKKNYSWKKIFSDFQKMYSALTESSS